MRGSSPVPLATSSMLASAASQRLAISLMKEILVTRKALAAYFIVSALVMSVINMGASMPEYSWQALSAALSILGSNDNTAGVVPVFDSLSFTQKLRIRNISDRDIFKVTPD